MICILLSSIFLEITLSLAQRSEEAWHVRVVRTVNMVYGLLFYFLGFQAIRVGVSASHHRESQRLQRALRRLALAALFGALVQPMLSCRPVSLTFMRVATFSQAKAFLTDVQRLAVASATPCHPHFVKLRRRSVPSENANKLWAHIKTNI